MSVAADRLLIIDDDSEIRQLLRHYLADAGYATRSAGSGREMRRLLRAHPADLIVLDLMLPDENGLEICRSLRADGIDGIRANTPVIMLTARGDATDRIVGLEMGADDYLAKPFEPRELLARIKGVLRRVRALPPGERGACYARNLCFDGWTLDTMSRQLQSAAGVIIPLSSAEFRLLRVFLDHPGRVLTRDQLMELAGVRDGGVFDRSIDMTVSRLRRRLGDRARSARLLKTVWGRGYVLTAAVETG